MKKLFLILILLLILFPFYLINSLKAQENQESNNIKIEIKILYNDNQSLKAYEDITKKMETGCCGTYDIYSVSIPEDMPYIDIERVRSENIIPEEEKEYFFILRYNPNNDNKTLECLYSTEISEEDTRKVYLELFGENGIIGGRVELTPELREYLENKDIYVADVLVNKETGKIDAYQIVRIVTGNDNPNVEVKTGYTPFFYKVIIDLIANTIQTTIT